MPNIRLRQYQHYDIGAFRHFLIILSMCLFQFGCGTLGPDFEKPETPTVDDWFAENPSISRETAELSEWWKVFNDPVLDKLVEESYQQNLSLQITGLRIIEARAQLGIAIGNQYPQTQIVGGSATRDRVSESSPNFNPTADNPFSNYQLGFDASWELDFWGRFQRGIESADASLNATVADYDDALVSLAAEVARVYVTIRTLETQLTLSRENIALQRNSLRIAQVRYDNGATTELDVQQAKTSLADTQARVPALTLSLYQAMNGLSILIGKPPGELELYSADAIGIPAAPAQIAAGIPADLLRRRPDVRKAEFQAASQSALIGVAKADLYPSFSLFGSIGIQSSDVGDNDAGDLFDSDSLTYSVGPVFSWNIFNYGRIHNNVRVQDVRYQQSLVNYRDTVLRAYQETEDAMIAFAQSQTETDFREQSAIAAARATELANIQYREGAVDFQRVIDTERSLVAQQEQWTRARGDIALNLIAMYKALGGGWAWREGKPFVSQENRDAMAQRTDWGQMLDPEASDAKQ
jgi:NodT family efflux transporter outer membrane factor (OMF) lipoprotein